MAEIKLNIGLEGIVSMADYGDTISRYREMVEALCTHLDRQGIVTWELSNLAFGSATLEFTGSSLDVRFLDAIDNGIIAIGQYLQGSLAIPFPYSVIKPAAELTHVINERVTAIRLGTEKRSLRIDRHVATPPSPSRRISYGEIIGTVETLQRRQNQFAIYDEIFDERIVCRLRPAQQEMMRDFWGKLVVVTGELESDATTGHVMAVRRVDDVHLVQDVPPGSYEKACGIIDFGTDRPEVLLRRLRDAE